LLPTDEAALKFAIDFGLIDKERVCDCGSKMSIHSKSQEKHGLQFRCSAGKTTCRKTKSILTDSWFAKNKTDIRTALFCVAAYANSMNNSQFSFLTGLKSTESITNWKAFFRDICSNIINDGDAQKIGGPGLTVEVDETLVFKRKNHCGRLLQTEIDETWILGGICRETDQAFIVPVPDRTAPTLLRAIHANIVSGSKVFTDFWASYTRLSEEGFFHSRVNHSYNFLNPEDKNVHTQKIERMWRTLKSVIPKGCSSETRWSYLGEFIFKQRHGWYSLTPGQRICLILNKIKTIKFL
jgi:hypothetical protein